MKEKVKKLLKTKYWEILGGGMVEHDEGCAYYDDIIENYQMGLRFLKEEFGYRPRVAILRQTPLATPPRQWPS